MVLILHVVIRDHIIRLLPLALRSVNPRFELHTVFILKYFINPSMEYLIAIWLPSVSKIVQKQRGTRFLHCSCHCKTVSNSVCLSEGATVTKGAELTDRSIEMHMPALVQRGSREREREIQDLFAQLYSLSHNSINVKTT